MSRAAELAARVGTATTTAAGARRRHAGAVVLVTAVAALLRFSTLDVQSFWVDEAVTVRLLHMDFADMLAAIPESERTPPLYYVLAWLWSHVFGTGEVGLRSLSALFGTATIPVAYRAATLLVSRRAGLVTAALAAVNPLLIWYSQEARAYALLGLLGSLSLLFFAAALSRPTNRNLAWWACASALALLAHYFAVFLAAGEALVLVAAAGRRRAAVLAAAVPVAVGAALLPLALDQAAGTEFEGGLRTRVLDVPRKFLIGEMGAGAIPHHALLAAGLVLAGLVLLVVRGDARERRGASVALFLAAVATAVPLVLAVAGADYVLARNFLAAWFPATIVYASGFAAHRARWAGVVAAAALSALFLSDAVHVVADENARRDDWRGVAAVLGRVDHARVIDVVPGGEAPLAVYLARVRPLAGAACVREVALVRPVGSAPGLPPAAPPSFELLEQRRVQRLEVVRFRSRAPHPIERGRRAPALFGGPSVTLVQDPPRGIARPTGGRGRCERRPASAGA